MIKIGLLLKSYAIDKPYEWQRQQLDSIDRPSAYRIDTIVSIFLVNDSENKYQLVYKREVYSFDKLRQIKSLIPGLYLLSLDSQTNAVNNYCSLSNLITRQEPIEFEGVTYCMKEASYKNFFFRVSAFSWNYVIQKVNDKKLPFSAKENAWFQYVCEVNLYERFAQNLPSLFRQYVDSYLEERNIVSKFDIADIVKDLTIEIYEVFRNKVGGDDSYFVHEVRDVSYDKSQLDKYLIEYLKIGNREIHRDSGYTSAYNMAIPNLKTGHLPEDDVKPIREQLIKEYSSQSHVHSRLHDIIEQYVKVATIPKRHRFCDGLISYLFSQGFVSDLEHILGGGSYVREWDNFDEHIKFVNSKLAGLVWYK